jgi:acetylornithine deacetylase/succinyl-diaminopimelate desuccinylase-like protein
MIEHKDSKIFGYTKKEESNMSIDLDWPTIQDEALRLLQALIRFDTTNPPGNELPAAQFVAEALRAVGYEPTVLESAPGRGNVIARLEGDGSERPLLLFGHLDVVPAEPEHWTHPPFEGVIADGFLWGRGALDMKNIVATQLATMLAFKRARVRPRRDIIYAATADEEAGGAMGVKWLLEEHPDLLDAEYALSEFGGFSLEVEGQRFYLCQTGEKGIAWLKMRTQGRPGHGSMPHTDSAVLRLSEAVAKLGQASLPLHISPTARAMIEGMARVQPALRELLSPQTNAQTVAQLPPEQALMFNAITHNTVAVTGLNAGYKHNVIPSSAEASLDCRTIPGQTAEDVIREIEAVVGDEVELEVVLSSPATESRFDTPLFEAMVRHLKAYDPEAEVVPLLLFGGTDGRFLGWRGVTYYGYSPIRLPADLKFMQTIHGHDERIPVDAFREGVRVFAETVLDFCTA